MGRKVEEEEKPPRNFVLAVNQPHGAGPWQYNVLMTVKKKQRPSFQWLKPQLGIPTVGYPLRLTATLFVPVFHFILPSTHISERRFSKQIFDWGE